VEVVETVEIPTSRFFLGLVARYTLGIQYRIQYLGVWPRVPLGVVYTEQPAPEFSQNLNVYFNFKYNFNPTKIYLTYL